MDTYIKYLLEDIRLAQRKEEEEPVQEETFEDHIRNVEQFISGDAEQTLAYHCGLKPEAFPPADQLNDDQMTVISRALDDLLKSWNAHVDIPEEVPAKMRYPLMVNLLNRSFTFIPSGFLGLDFCTGNPEDCELGDYCSCRDIE
ncbi:MAG: hypothetical protein EA362_03770 [Saprospirales bacterium]|nr:MAG: hypothetical protein EA362_03770 [Saprospirales bacterium]